MIYLFSRCYGVHVISQAYDYIETVLFIIYIIYAKNDQSTDSVVLKAKLQQQLYT